MAWIPIFDVYLLGKLTINKFVGWILVICIFLTGTYTTTINGVETIHTILPESISCTISTIYNIAFLGLFIYAIVKYNRLKKEKIASEQSIQSTTNQQQAQELQGNINNQATIQDSTNLNNL
ncbi:MAG: hypothetical protein PUA90_00505 [bacterium]|nr:hypothetical protein [bacterium]